MRLLSPQQFFLYLLILINGYIFSQGFTYKRFTTKDGLPSNEIGHICQDKQGYIWFISGDNLIKYDGLKFQIISDKNYQGWSLFNENIRYVPSIDKFVFTSGTNVVLAKHDFSYYSVDTSLIYFYDKEREANMASFIYVDKNGFVVFTRDKSKNKYPSSDTLYYWHDKSVKFVKFPSGYSRNGRMKILHEDIEGNVYVRLLNKSKNEITFYLFDHGNLKKLFSYSVKLNIDDFSSKIIEDKKGSYWLYSDSLICLFKNSQLIKSYTFKELKNTLLSKPSIDSKNNIWVSSRTGLFKFNYNGFTWHEDRNRQPNIRLETYYDENGSEKNTKIVDYINFYNTNFIDRFDNVYNGYRMFDGNLFTNWGNSYGEFANDFRVSNKDLSSENFISLLEGFSDSQDNLWFSSSKGLILASPTPYKCLDKTYNYNLQDFKFSTKDKKGRSYYLKAVEDSSIFYIMRVDKENLSFKKLNKTYHLRLVPYYNGVVIEQFNSFEDLNFLYFDEEIELKYSKVPKHYKALDYNDTIVFMGKNDFIIGTPNNWYTVIHDGNVDFSFSYKNKIVTQGLNYFRIVKDKLEKGKFFNYPASDTSLNTINKQMVLWDPFHPDNDTVYAYNKYFRVFRKIGDKETIFNFKKSDTLISKFKNQRPWDCFRINTFKDLILFSTLQNGVVIYRLNEKTKELDFHSFLNYANGLPGKNDFYMYVQGDYLSIWSSFPHSLRIWNYNDIKSANFEKNYEYIDYNTELIDAFPVKNKYGQIEINSQISYVGQRGFNTTPPPIIFNSISYFTSDGLLHEVSSLSKEIKIPYDFHDVYLEFKGICLAEGNKLKYKTKLIGHDEDWSITNAEFSYVKYPTLNPGTYTFVVTAANNHGVWNEQPISFTFEILPPWYKTWWAYSGYVIFGFLGVFSFTKSRTRKLEKEKDKLEATVKERTEEVVKQKEIVEHQKHIVEEKQKEILDSINYAKRIQYTLLAHADFLQENIPNHFVYFNPKDIVSGDFYWATKRGNKFYLAVCDSTGHGVPGAFMSLLNISFLNEAVNEKGIEEPNKVFDFVRQRLIDNISKEGQKDGFDGILICIETLPSPVGNPEGSMIQKEKTTSSSKGLGVRVTYAAANNAPILIKTALRQAQGPVAGGAELVEAESDRMPVGMGERKENFKLFTVDAQKGDALYLYTDGYADQFGGPKGKKFKYKPLNELILANHTQTLSDQKEILKTTFENWRGNLEQIDDVCIIGIRL